MTLLDALRPWLPRRRRLTLRNAAGEVETGAFGEIEAHQSSRDPEPAWCPRCNLRSAFEVEQILARSDTLGRFRLTVCLDCGWSDPPAEEEPTP